MSFYRKGQHVCKSTKKKLKTEAKTELIKEESRAQGASYNDGKLRFQTLLEDLYNDYLINRRKSIKDLVYKMDAYLYPYFGDMLVSDVTPQSIQAYVRQRIEAKVKNGTINRELSYILRAFNLGALNGRISFVPKIRKLKEAPPRTDSYTEEDCIELYKKLPDYIQAIVIFANYTGWRRSEIIRIKKEHVDLEKNEVWIPPGESKNEQARVIAMCPQVREVVINMVSSSSVDYQYVFHRNGRQIKSFRTAWERARKDAKLDHKTFHAFRRTAAMRFDAKGVSTRVIMEMMGHKTRAMFDNYRRVASKEIHEAVKLLEEDKKDES